LGQRIRGRLRRRRYHLKKIPMLVDLESDGEEYLQEMNAVAMSLKRTRTDGSGFDHVTDSKSLYCFVLGRTS